MANPDLLKEVSEQLNACFEDLGCGINADEIYLNSVVVNDLGEPLVESYRNK